MALAYSEHFAYPWLDVGWTGSMFSSAANPSRTSVGRYVTFSLVLTMFIDDYVCIYIYTYTDNYTCVYVYIYIQYRHIHPLLLVPQLLTSYNHLWLTLCFLAYDYVSPQGHRNTESPQRVPRLLRLHLLPMPPPRVTAGALLAAGDSFFFQTLGLFHGSLSWYYQNATK